MTGLSKKLMFILIPVVVLLIGCAGLLIFLPDGSAENVYVEQINTARRLAENGDYQQAIIYYKNAINQDDTREDPYIELANIYFYLNMNDEGIRILKEGIAKTNSTVMLQTLKKYENGDESDDFNKLNTVKEVKFNSTYANVFATYDFGKYADSCTVKKEQTVSDIYTVVYEQYDAVFEYANSLDNKVLDPSTGRPYAYARPTSIKLNQINLLIEGTESGVSMDELKESGANNIKILPYDKDLGTYLISFELNNMQIKVACDKDGTISKSDSYSEIIPQKAEAANTVSSLNGKMVNADDNSNVKNVTLKFRAGTNAKSGEVVETVNSADGTFYVELEPGDYTMEASAKDFITEYYGILITDGEKLSQSFIMSPKLAANQIRFVIEWPETQYDIYLHLKGYTAAGDWTEYGYSFGGVSEYIGSPDEGQRDGKRFESATLFDSKGKFEFHVHGKYNTQDVISAGTVVKIYLGNETDPVTIGVPDSFFGPYWVVCRIEDGVIKDINGKQN